MKDLLDASFRCWLEHYGDDQVRRAWHCRALALVARRVGLVVAGVKAAIDRGHPGGWFRYDRTKLLRMLA
jgi:hypothetical protein